MADVMKVWLSLSLSGGILILVLWLGRVWFQERFSRRWQYYIWLLVIARLWIPFAPAQNLVGVLFQSVEQAGGWIKDATEEVNDRLYEKQEQEAEWIEWNPEADGKGAGNPGSGAGMPDTVEERGGGTAALLRLAGILNLSGRAAAFATIGLSIVWLAGACSLLVYKMFLYRRFTKMLRAGWSEPEDMEVLERFGRLVERSGVRGSVRLYTNPHVASPLLIGFFHPSIVLPAAQLPETDFTYTILHELTHFKRRDLFYKWLVQITVCMHWFNPLVHLMGREINRLCELSCDEAVIQTLNERERRAYGDTLLHAVFVDGGYRNNLASVTLCEGKELLKERLGAIMKYKKKSKMLVAVTFACTVILVAGAVSVGAYGATGSSGSWQWESKKENGETTHSYRQDGYYEAPYIIEMGWNLSEPAYSAYSARTEIPLNGKEVVKAAFAPSCASYKDDEEFMKALTALAKRISEKDLNSQFALKLERPLVQSVQDVGGRDLGELAGEYYRDRKLTSFNAIFPELDSNTQDALCGKMYEDSNTAFFSSAAYRLDPALLNKYAEKAYQDNRLTFFAPVSYVLSEEEAAAYARRAFADGRITFFDELLPYLSKEEIRSYAEKAYQEGNIAVFSIVISYLPEEDYQAFTERAKKDHKTPFSSVLADYQ